MCNYSLVGINPDGDYQVTCPECGSTLRPRDPDEVFVASNVHRYFFKKLTLPTAAPAFGLLIFSWIPNLGLIFALLHTPAMFIWCTTFWIIVSTKLIKKSSLHPRPMPLRIIPLLGLLYLFPAIALTYLYWLIGSYFIIPV